MKQYKAYHIIVRAALTLAFAVFTNITAWAATETLSYIDADGTEKSVEATILTESETELGTNDGPSWYVVVYPVNFNHQLTINGDVHLILVEGSSMTVNQEYDNENILVKGHLNIYGVTKGSGSITISGQFYGIRVINGGSVTINGGSITDSSSYGSRIEDDGTITLAGGTVTTGVYYDGALTIADGWTYTDGSSAILTASIDEPAEGATYQPAWKGGGESATDPYLIKTTAGLDLLAKRVNSGADSYSGKYFQLGADITYSHKAANEEGADTENNYTAIGYFDFDNERYFSGHFDGNNKTISGIRIYKGGKGLTDDNQGIFGKVEGGTVENVILADARITGKDGIGGIVGNNYDGRIENCHVLSDVTIHSVTVGASDHGGIVGSNVGTVSGCTSAATLTIADDIANEIANDINDDIDKCEYYGGIAGFSNSTISNCLYLGSTVGGNKYVGAIVGINNDGTVRNCYYTDANFIGLDGSGNALDHANSAVGHTDATATVENVGLAYTLTLAEGITSNTFTVGGYTVAVEGQDITLGYTGEAPEGYDVRYSIDGGTTLLDGNTFEMPASDVTVSAVLIQVSGTCGNKATDNVTWEVTDTNGDGSLETLTICGTGAMKNYTNSNPAPWAAFKDDITTAVIEEGVTSIGHNAFYQFTALTSVSIASSVTSIGAATFFECTNLATINGASGVTYVESSAFDDTAWRNTLPNGLTYVGHVAYLFKGTDTSVNLDAGTTQIYDNCFWGTGIRVVVIPASVTSIGSGAFAESGLDRAYFLGTTPPTLESNVFNCIATLVVPATAYEEYSAFQVDDDCTWECGYTISCGEGITATSFAPIVAEDETVTLGYTGEVPTGYEVRYSLDGGTTLLVGNTFQMPDCNVTVTATYTTIPWSGTGTETDPFIIEYPSQLDLLAQRVNSGADSYGGKYFQLGADIEYTGTNTYTAIGSQNNPFCGHFDGNNKTISGIRIHKDDSFQGLFGYINGEGDNKAEVKNVILDHATINALEGCGGIVGINAGGIIENCHVNSNVTIQANQNNSFDLGGIAGFNNSGCTINGCTSAAIIRRNGNNGVEYGGIAGNNQGTVSNCLYLGNTVEGTSDVGAIVGKNSSTVSNCYFTYSGLNRNAIGTGVAGTNCGYAQVLTLGEGITLDATATTVYGPLTAYDNFALSYNDGNTTTLYSTYNATVTLGYTGEVPAGCDVRYSLDGGTTLLVGNTFQMPNSNVTVSAVLNGPDCPFVVTTWADLRAKMATGGYIRLNADVTDPYKTNSSYLNVPTGKTVTLDLNGHTIDRGLTEETTQGYVIYVNGTLTLNDSSNPSTGRITGGYGASYGGGVCVSGSFTMNSGTISGNTSKYGGGVCVSRTFTMYGGTISGNTSKYGGGVYLADNTTFTMNGGTICGNTSGSNGGGVYLQNDRSTFNVSGNPVITGNTNAAGKEENFYLNNVINIDAPLTAGAFIGVTSNDPPSTGGAPVEIATGATDGDSQYFYSDITCYTIKDGQGEQAGKLLLTPPASTPWSKLKENLEADGTNGVVTLSDNVTALDCDGGDPNITKTVTLDLNGHSITVNENSDHVILMNDYGNLTLTGSGTISGSKEYVVNCNYSTSTFSMIGGTISGGTGGGVYVKNGTFNVSGSPVITGNTRDGKTCNVYLNTGKVINVTGALSADAHIGVTTKTAPTAGNPVTFAQGSGNYTLTAADVSRFSSDVSGYFIGFDNENHVAYLTVDATDANIIITLADNADNTSIITDNNSKTRTAVLSGRTLYKDGAWNTLCLPFDATLTGDLADATLMELDTEAGSYEHVTGLDNGTLYLNFKDATSIKAGKPYIIKWDGTYIGDPIVNPVFPGVTINNSASTEVIFTGGSFKGTYKPIVWNEENKSILFLGDNNTLFWPQPEGDNMPRLNAFRAYFELSDGAGVREFNLNFDGEETTSITTTDSWTSQAAKPSGTDCTDKAGAWYDMQGRKVSKPTKKGMYIHNGSKVVVK